MPPRPYWSGQLRVSLVSFPVQLFSATTSEHQIQLNQIHRPSGERIRYEKVVPEIGPVDDTDIVKGYEHSKGAHVLLRQEEIDDLKLESKKVIDLVRFVDADGFDTRYFEKPYYLMPDGEAAAEGYAIIRDALQQAGKIGIGQLILNGRSNVVAVRPFAEGLLLEMLRTAQELRSADSFFGNLEVAEPDEEAIAMAEALIERSAGPFEPEAFRDEYHAALRELIDSKLEHRKPEIVQPTGAPAGNVVNIMDALKKSMKQNIGAAKLRSGKAVKEGVATRSGRKEDGKKTASPRRPGSRSPSRDTRG